MRVHHLDCVSACPLGGLLMDGESLSLRGRLASHCLLVETPRSLVLVDTGYGLRDVAKPRSRLNPIFLALLRPQLREELTAARQIQALGYDVRDVRHIVLSHLDFDHAGGLDDFPEATVHLMQREVESASARKTMLDRMRYRPQQWGTRSQWQGYETDSAASWRGFACVRELRGLPPEILMLPLPGHTLGHAGVAVEHAGGALLYAGDAYFYHTELAPTPYCTPGLALYQRLMEKDRDARLHNQQRLRTLALAQQEVTVFCAHDPQELAWLRTRRPAAQCSIVPETAIAAQP